MKQLTVTLVCLLVFVCLGFSKNGGTITGKVIDSQHDVLTYANIILYAAADSSVVKLELSDEQGAFRFADLPASSYYVEVSYVGMPNQSTAVFQLEEGATHELAPIQLATATNELSEVTVTAQKPLLELKPDMMVMNVENSATSAGKNALELLRTAPGIVVDNNENLALMGKTSVRVYIDGKPSPLTGADLANFLRSTPATDIEAIEIITNPSAKYDAEGNAGIINIKMKKDKNLGANTTLNLGYTQGQLMRYNGGITSNYRNKKVNVFGSYSHYHGANFNQNDFHREQYGFYFDQTFRGEGGWNSHNYRLGTDVFLNKKHTIGFLVNGYQSDGNWDTNGSTVIGMLATKSIDSVLVSQNLSDWKSKNRNYNVNYKFEGSEGRSLNIDADYGTFRNSNEEYQPNTYKDAKEEIILSERIIRLRTPKDIDIYTLKADYEMPIGEAKLGLGAKTSYITTDNVFDFFNVVDEQDVLNETLSNQFKYTENVNAAYANYSQQFKDLGVQVGLRMEQTNSEGDLIAMQSTGNENVKREYLDFFPSAGLTYKLNEDNSFQLNYSRRINRPNYQDLNPFESRIDELTSEKGNPFLLPEYANKLQLTHTFKYALNTSLAYTHTKDVIARMVDVNGEKSTFITWRNLAEQRDFSINVSGSVPVTEWLSTYTSLTGMYQENDADYGDGKIIDLNVATFNAYSQMNFKLPKGFNFELSGFYSSPSVWEGTVRMNEMWAVNAGLQKKILNGKGTLKASFSDIFRSQRWSGVSDFGDLYMNIAGFGDSRRVQVNFSYLFGNNQVKSRRRSTGLEEESSRVKSEN